MSRHGDSAQAVKVGVIGCGRVACDIHLPLLKQMPGVTVTALADPAAERVAAAAAIVPGAARYDDAFRLLDDADVDAVLIAAPTALHGELAERAIRAGRHVYLEKPLAASLAQGRSVVEAWRSSGLAGMIGFNYRFHPLYGQLRQAAAQQRIGRTVALRSVFTTAAGVPQWKERRATGGGALLDLASHEIDLIRFVLDDEIASVSAVIQSRETEHDTACLQLQTRGGVSAQVLCAFGAAEEAAMELWGETGSLSISRYGSLAVSASPAGARGPLGRLAAAVHETLTHAPEWWRRRSHRVDPSYAAALANFLQAVRGVAPAAVDFTDGLHALAVTEAAEQSASTGAVVRPAGFEAAPPSSAHSPASVAQEQLA